MPTDLAEYFRSLTKERSVRAIAQRAKVEQTTMNRQLTGRSSLTVEVVVAICRAYDLDLAQVFVSVGFITEEEARRFASSFALADFTDQELTREMVRRLDSGEATAGATETVAEELIEDVLAERRAEKALRPEDDIPYIGHVEVPQDAAADKNPRKADSAPLADDPGAEDASRNEE